MQSLNDLLAESKYGAPSPSTLGTGGAQRAGQAMYDRGAYLRYVEAQQMQGAPAMSYPEWVKMMRAQPAQQGS